LSHFYLLAVAVVGVMLVWVNVHGGFVAGLGTISIYAGMALMYRFLPRMARRGGADPSPNCLKKGEGETPMGSDKAVSPRVGIMLAVLLGSLLVTCINPYGAKFWYYLLPAVLAKRPLITEWQPLPIFASDTFTPFRVLFLLVLLSIVIGWTRVQKKSWTGLMMLVVTSYLGWRSRRHAPFLGVAALAFAGPYLAATIARVKESLSRPLTRTRSLASDANSSIGLFVTYGALAIYAAIHWLPDDSLQVLAPVGDVPVREADILSLAHVKGNLAIPFDWGSYSAWRLYPNIKISMDGRYEAAYPESTFLLNAIFFGKAGPHWDLLLRTYQVDYVILNLSSPGLRPADLAPYGYSLIWTTPGCSALMALTKHAPGLRQIADALPPSTIDPLDARIPDHWWSSEPPNPPATVAQYAVRRP